MDSILIIGPSWVGDMVMSQTLYKALKAKQPDVAIDVLAPAWTEPLLSVMPEVRTAITMPLAHGQFEWSVRRRLGVALRGENYRQAIVLPNSWKSALIPWFANIPQRTGWRGEMRYGLLNDLRVLDNKRLPYMVQRYVALSNVSGKAPDGPDDVERPSLSIDADRAEQLREKLQIDTSRPLIGICPGAEFGPAKRWPEEHFAAVAEQRIDAGERVLIFGSKNDFQVAENVLHRIPPQKRMLCKNLAGKTSLDEALHALSFCQSVVSNDSGLMHIAAALRIPLVAVYGSTSTGFTPPLGDNVKALNVPVDCGPCFERQCPLQHKKCLTGLRPTKVIDALEHVAAF